jgi:soluble lytic murein transglycosylase-like protein
MRFVRVIRSTIFAASALCVHFAHGALVVVGALAAALLSYTLWERGLDAFRPLVNPILVLTSGAPRAVELADEQVVNLSPRMRAVGGYLSRKYRVADSALEKLLAAAEDAGAREGVDPLLLIAVMAVESGFNPIAQSNMGAQGLMQVIPRFHQDKLEGLHAGMLEPATNIRVGARVLKAYIAQAGSVSAALQVYCGSPSDPDAAYASRVMDEMQQIEEVARAARA